jgi:PAS domain S-box-containing protein
VKILVVEDEKIVAWDIKETLEKLGHQVVDLAVSGAAAIRAAVDKDPELVLMDIRLEGEMDGITAGNEIYQRLKIPVVYLSAHADEITLARAIKTAPFGYIIKPFQAQTLQSTIQVAHQRHQVEACAQMTQTSLGYTLDNIGSGIIVTDRQGAIASINPIAQTLTGWNSAEAVGVEIERVFRLIWETDGTAIENPSSRAMRLQAPVKSPERCWLRSKDNLEVPISDTATPIFEPDGEVVGSIVIFQDNTKQLSTQMDLWERNQDLELFQFKLISRLQAKTAEYHQAIACLQVWDLILERVNGAQTESELLQSALWQLGKAIAADYCWVTLHDPQANTATICCEYIDRERPIYPTSKLGKQIDLQLYPRFYHHLLAGENWTVPPAAFTPKPYLDLLTPSAQVAIFPLARNYTALEDLAAQQSDAPEARLDLDVIGEVGIVTTGKHPWTLGQTSPIAQILSGAIKLFRQQHHKSSDPTIEWLDRFKDDFPMSADVNRDLHIAAQLQHQFPADGTQADWLPAVGPIELSIELEILEAQWQRQVLAIDILIDVQANGTTAHIQSLSDLLFYKWSAAVVKSCGDLAQRYRLDFSDRITDTIPASIRCPFAMLELAILELFHSACKYTPPEYPIVLEVNICDNLLQLSVVSLEVALSAPELEQIFRRLNGNLPAIDDTSDNLDRHAPQPASTALGFALVQKLVIHLGGNIQTHSDRDSTRLILSMPLLAIDAR